MAKRPTINATFGPLLLSFPKITAPDEKFGVYSANAVGDPGSKEIKAAQAIIDKAMATFELDPEDAKTPLSMETRKDPDHDPNSRKKPKRIQTGKMILKSKSKQPPAVFDSKGREINPKGLDIRGGTRARVQGYLAPYDVNGNEGISFTLTGIQIIEMAKSNRGGGFEQYEDEDGEGWTMGAEEEGLGLADDDDESPEDAPEAPEDGDDGDLDI
jgi:hypothetical protein